MFWRKKPNKAAESGSRLEVPVLEPIPDDKKLGDQLKALAEIVAEVGRSNVCVHCQRDVRAEQVLTVRYISSFFALFPGGVDGKETHEVSLDDAANNPWLGFSVCTSCALTRNIPGLDRAKLSALLAGLPNTNPATH